MKSPVLLVFGGPNGSGKSTVNSQYPIIGHYVNADDIQSQLKCSSLDAAKIAEATREALLSQGMDFTFESVLSTERNYNLMRKAKEEMGYRVVCVYILTTDPTINVSRVEARARNGGHDVPADKVRLRYHRAMKLLPQLFEICDECYIYDNSTDRSAGTAQMIVKWQYGKMCFMPNNLWSKEMLDELCSGNYAVEK